MNMDRSTAASNKMNNGTNDNSNDKDGSLQEKITPNSAAPIAEVHHWAQVCESVSLEEVEQNNNKEEAPRATKKPRRSSSSSSSSSSSHSQGSNSEDELTVVLEEFAPQYRELKRTQDALRADTMKVLVLLNAVRTAIHCRRGVERHANVTSCSPGPSKVTLATAPVSSSGPADSLRISSVHQPLFDTSAAATNSALLGTVPLSSPEHNDGEREREQFARFLGELMEKEMERAATTNATVARDRSAAADTEATAMAREGVATVGAGAGANALAGEAAAAAPSRTTTTTSSFSPRPTIPDDSSSSSCSSAGGDAVSD